jgi:hypothetical protein
VTTSSDLQSAIALFSQAGTNFTAGANTSANDTDAITSYQTAAILATRAAVLASNAAQASAASNPAAYEFAVSAFNAAETAGDSMNSTNGSKVRSNASTYATTAIAAGNLAIQYATSAANATSGPYVPPVAKQPSAATITAASQLNYSLEVTGCECTTTLQPNVTAFQNAFNADVAAGNITGTQQVVASGNYDYATAYALSIVNGGASTSPCFGDGSPCYGVVPQVAGTAIVRVATYPTTVPTHPTPPVGTDWTPWIVGGLAGLGAIAYFNRKHLPRIPAISRLSGSTKTALLVGGGATAAVAAAITFWPTPTPTPRAVTKLVQGQLYTVVTGMPGGQTDPVQSYSALGWLITKWLYPAPAGSAVQAAWPTNLPGVPAAPNTAMIVFEAIWTNPSGPVPASMVADFQTKVFQ